MSPADRFKPYAPDAQAVVRLEKVLPPEHPVHVFVDRVRSVDLGHFVIPPGPKGEKPYHPHALFGVRSARKLARLARQEATFVYLAGGGQPWLPSRNHRSCRPWLDLGDAVQASPDLAPQSPKTMQKSAILPITPRGGGARRPPAIPRRRKRLQPDCDRSICTEE